MQLVVASGKGGTGKTTVSVNLALALSEERPIRFIDCDVEEPNAHIFLKPQISSAESVVKLLPKLDEKACTACGACSDACQFGAIGRFGEQVLIYDALCHGCGLCTRVCPVGALSEVPHELGLVETGTARGFPFARGVLNVGEAMATPIIRELKRASCGDADIVIDAPPGTGCPAIASLSGADLALLVTEPTPFGLHDLRAAVAVARVLDVPVAVVINRSDVGTADVDAFCAEEGIPVLLRIRFDRAIAKAYAHGHVLVDVDPYWHRVFIALAKRIAEVSR